VADFGAGKVCQNGRVEGGAERLGHRHSVGEREGDKIKGKR
jgi:hypothetical protein